MTALVRASSNCKRQTRLLVREGAPTSTNSNILLFFVVHSAKKNSTSREIRQFKYGSNITQLLNSASQFGELLTRTNDLLTQHFRLLENIFVRAYSSST
jgi:hypothetical protein